MGNSKFVNVNINVDGKTYKAKVQEGLVLGDLYGNGASYFKNNTIFQNNSSEYGEVAWKMGKNEIKMSKSEFALFKNIADNHDEKMGLTLSKKDFDIAIDLYCEGKFTKDISRNLPEGDYAEPHMQDRYGDNYLQAGTKNAKLAIQPYNPDNVINGALDLDYITEKLKNNVTEEVYIAYSGDGIEETYYIDNEGWTCFYNGDKRRTTTDSEGNTVEETYNTSHKIMTTYITKTNGTKEYYINGRLEERTYTKDNKKIHEEYENGKLARREITWDDNKKIYNGKNELIYESSGEYYKEYSNGNVTEELKDIEGSDCYYLDGKLITADGQKIKQQVSNYNVENNPYFNKYEKLDSKTIANEIKELIRFFSKGEKTAEMLDAIPFEKRAEVLAEYKDMTGNNLFEDLYDEWGIEESNIKQFMKDFYHGYISNKKSHNGEDLKMLKVSNSESITKEEILNLEQYMLNNP